MAKVVLLDTLNDQVFGPFEASTSEAATEKAFAYAVEFMKVNNEPFNASEGGYEGYRAEPGLVFNDGWTVQDIEAPDPKIVEKVPVR